MGVGVGGGDVKGLVRGVLVERYGEGEVWDGGGWRFWRWGGREGEG